MADTDVIVIGSGHNGLVCGAYLAKAGYKVTVFERRDTIGGAVCTEEMFGGFKMDVGGSAHFMIHHTPIVRELELDKYGLEYIELDPFMV
ncbi:MAG: phytoene desaturase family protein, partial [Spirochaetota bacterium]